MPAPLIAAFFHALTNTWSYVVSDADGGTAAIIDPVLDFDVPSGVVSTAAAQALLAHVHTHRLRVSWILETHAHADHLSASDWLRRQLAHDGARPQLAIGAGIVGVQRHFRRVFALADDFRDDGSQFDRLLQDGERLPLGTLEIQVLSTPGHTADSLSYRIGDAVFIGDTLFSPAAGSARCDFPGGNAVALFASIQRLYALPDATRLFLCHDYPPAGGTPRCEVPLPEMRASNLHVRSETSQAEYVDLRSRRDATLAVPRLLYPSLQVNIRAGVLPAADQEGRVFFKLPVRAELD